MGVKLEDKKRIDAEITQAFLKHKGNNRIAEGLAGRFSSIISRRIQDKDSIANKCHFYLKGGNAISVLEGEARTGDYDFQFAPKLCVYEEWDKAFEDIDKLLLEVLQEAVAGIGDGEVFQDDCVDLDQIINSVLPKKPADLQKPKGHNCSIQLLGREYARHSYGKIKREEIEVNGRKRIGSFRISEKGLLKPEKHGLHIYVNYMIPGFLLYRLVRTFECRLEGEKVAFKSELIDVSVPRPGSAECHLSQEGVITHFRKKDEFRIPGWGYHFYENISLLQEVALNRSGSPQKRTKRKTRLDKAVKRLLESNGYNVLPLLDGSMREDQDGSVWEYVREDQDGSVREYVREDKNRSVLGYSGAVHYPLPGLDPEEAGLREHIQKETLRHFKTVAGSITWTAKGITTEGAAAEDTIRNLGDFIPGEEDKQGRIVNKNDINVFAGALAELFASYHTKLSRDSNIITSGNAAEALGKLLKEAGVSDLDCYILTPLSELNPRLPVTAGFVRIDVKCEALKQLLDYADRYASKDVRVKEKNRLGLAVHAKGGAFYALFHERKDWDPEKLKEEKEHILQEMLNRSILFTQRCALEEFYQNR